jgi:hypothetical protein
MEKLSQINLWYLLLILFGSGLLTIVVIDLKHPVRSSLESATGGPNVLEENWFSEQTFDLLVGDQASLGGIDIGLIAELNPFEPVAPIVEPVESALATVEPEQSPPPATRPISVVYRGVYRSSGGNTFVYVEVEGAMRVISVTEEPVPSWEIDEVNAGQLILIKGGDTRVRIPINEENNLEVPIK